jgi:hypothetical protein
MNWQEVATWAAISAAVAIIFVSVDKLLLNRQKTKLNDRLLAFWSYVDDLRITDTPGKMAQACLSLIGNVFGERILHWRWWAVGTLISACLSIIILGFGAYAVVHSVGFGVGSGYSSDVVWALTASSAGYHQLQYVLPANFLGDGMTLVATILLLRVFVRRRSALYRLLIIAIDVVIALGLAFLTATFCAASLAAANEKDIFGLRPPSLNSVINKFASFMENADAILSTFLTSIHKYILVVLGIEIPGPYQNFDALLPSIMFGMTTLLPTIVYMSILYLLLTAKLITTVSNTCLGQVSELTIETGNSVFFYTATLLGIVATSLKLISEILRWAFG